GFDLIKNIRKLPGHQLTPLVLISAYDQDPKKIAKAYTEHGLFDFISKPILPDLLITKIRSYVDVYHMRQKNDFYDSLIDLNTDGYIDWKLDQKESNLVISKNLKLNLGYEESDLENSLDSLVSCIEENSRPIFLEAINEFLQNLSNKAKTLELQFRNKNRGSVWMISKLKLLRNELGEPLRIVGFMTNITKEKSATHDLQKSNDDLDEFAYLIAHDLREPLRGIKSYVDMLMMDNSDSLGIEVKEKLIKIQNLALHSNDLLEKLLFFSRVDKRQLSFATVNLNQQLDNVVVSLENLINEKSAVIDIKKLPPCYCDSVRVPEVFRNLIENALRYNDSIQPVVEIGVCKKSDVRAECLEGIDLCKDDVVYYVKDNGIGIPLKHFKNIFKMFKSIHGRNSKYGLSTGFGLSFAKKIVENHHGQIWVDSDLGHGSCFYFTMPNTQIPINTSNLS
ncbi:MAG: ATP-binding protein, partial [Chlamydiota bacterium]|nr:ATP-binding protein [Chlamydiota bacterium]